MEDEKYDNNICIIGKKINKIIKELGLFKEKNKEKLENNWIISSYNINNNEEIEQIYNKIITNINDMKEKSDFSEEIFSYTIIYSLDDLKKNKNEKDNITKLFNIISLKIEYFYYHPFFIWLAKDEKDKEELDSFISSQNDIKIDKRNIECFITPLNDNLEEKEKKIKLIKQKIYKNFSYFFEMGDEFKYKDTIFKLYEETKEKLFPINILILGKTQVGKSTFINTLLKEKRAKEGGEGFSETKAHNSYHIDNIPLIINDIEGFTGEENINKVVEKISKMQTKLEEKELHLVIYIIDYYGPTYFNDNEYMIFKQLSKKLDNTHFLFLCSKSKMQNNKQLIDKIQKSFYKMIKNGLNKKKEKENIMNVLNYLYFCQKKDIDYKEIYSNTENVNLEIFNNMNFYEKMKLKFSNYNEEDKNKEMINKIIEEDNNLIFINLKLDEEHNEIFGMNKVSKKIREALINIKNDNMKFLNENIKYNKMQKLELDKKIKDLEKMLEENKEINDFIDNDDNCIQALNNIKKNEETQSLLNESINELDSIEKKNLIYNDLINSINEKKVLKTKEYAKVIKEENIKSLKKDLLKHKIGGYVSGLIPFLDILIQHYIKENAKEKIAQKFNDDLIDFSKKDKKLSEKEKNSIKEMENKSDDKTSDILKSIGRGITLGINVIAKTIFLPIAFIGCSLGIIVGGAVMNYDINAFIDFYGNRFIYRCLINLSFDSIDNYLKNNFEKDEIVSI